MNKDHHPQHTERHRFDPLAADIRLSLKPVCWAARVRPERERRAMLWLAQFAARWPRLRRIWDERDLPPPLDVVGELPMRRLGQELGLDTREINEALTDPAANLADFVPAVEKLRARFEAALPPLATMSATAEVQKAAAFALRRRKLARADGPTRAGKTEAALHWWARNLDRVAWIDAPSDGLTRSFLRDAAAAVGIGISALKFDSSRLIGGLRECLGLGLIECLVVDEAHNLWPADPRSKPERIELLRSLHDTLGIGQLWLTTGQFSQLLAEALDDNPRWAPGQLVGRMTTFEVPKSATKDELIALARMRAGTGTPDAVLDSLVTEAVRSEGYIGSLIALIERARAEAGSERVPLATWVKVIGAEKARLDAQAKVVPMPARRGRNRRAA